VTVYVDNLENWGWKMRGRIVSSCHMFSDSLDLSELHCMADKIGMRRAWFQPHRIAPHYDLVASRRAAAVALGAIEVDRHQASSIWKARREACAHLNDLVREIDDGDNSSKNSTKLPTGR
jgi:hypothetical protein